MGNETSPISSYGIEINHSVENVADGLGWTNEQLSKVINQMKGLAIAEEIEDTFILLKKYLHSEYPRKINLPISKPQHYVILGYALKTAITSLRNDEALELLSHLSKSVKKSD